MPLLECNFLVFNKTNVSAQVCFSCAVWYFTSVPCLWLWPARKVSICSKKLSVWLLLLIWKVTVGEHINRTALLENCIWCIYSVFILSWAGWLSRWYSKLLPAVGSWTVLWGLCLDSENILLWQQTFPQARLDVQGWGTLLNFTAIAVCRGVFLFLSFSKFPISNLIATHKTVCRKQEMQITVVDAS